MTWIIIDGENVIQDISTNRGNLSRGHLCKNAKALDVTLPLGITIGDVYDPERQEFTKDLNIREERVRQVEYECKVQDEMRAIAIERLEARGELQGYDGGSD